MKVLKYIDIISPDITLHYNKSPRHKNAYSGFICLLAILAIIASSLYFIIRVFLRVNPIAYTLTKYLDEKNKIYFDHNGIFHYISLGGGKKFKKEAVSVYSTTQNYNLIFNGKNFLENDYWDYDICDSIDYKNVGKFVKNYNSFSNGLCISRYWDHLDQKFYDKTDKKFKYPHLDYGGFENIETTFSLVIERCTNSEENILNKNIQCLSISEIDDYINDVIYGSLFLIDNYIDVGQYKNPINSYFFEVTNSLFDKIKNININQLNFYPSVLETNDGLILNNNHVQYSHTFKQNEMISKALDNGTINLRCLFVFWMKNNAQVFKRTYSDFIETLVNIGGISNLIMKIAYLLNLLGLKYSLFHDTLIELNHLSKYNWNSLNNVNANNINTQKKLSLFNSTENNNRKLHSHNDLKIINNFVGIDKITTKKNENNNNNNPCCQLDNSQFKIMTTKKNDNNNAFSQLDNSQFKIVVNKSKLSEQSFVDYIIDLQKIENYINIGFCKYICFKSRNKVQNIKDFEVYEEIRKEIVSEEMLFKYFLFFSSGKLERKNEDKGMTNK